jgi:phage-related minor tail protein
MWGFGWIKEIKEILEVVQQIQNSQTEDHILLHDSYQNQLDYTKKLAEMQAVLIEAYVPQHERLKLATLDLQAQRYYGQIEDFEEEEVVGVAEPISTNKEDNTPDPNNIIL